MPSLILLKTIVKKKAGREQDRGRARHRSWNDLEKTIGEQKSKLEENNFKHVFLQTTKA